MSLTPTQQTPTVILLCSACLSMELRWQLLRRIYHYRDSVRMDAIIHDRLGRQHHFVDSRPQRLPTLPATISPSIILSLSVSPEPASALLYGTGLLFLCIGGVLRRKLLSVNLA
jgi:hypothetical protein